ncbi:MAG TPA: C40 family peptidase [Candidatus Eisenbergiella intestinipullorum]|nr:C40 family peptidase [Candidatus Eisenbergiella intestinipullorum]
MKYTRVKAVTCALTASVIIFGSAAHTNASGVSYDLPAAGVGLVLDEGSSLSSVQEEASSEEQKEEAVQEAEETPAVTSEDIEAGATGVGEASIDTEVVSHVQEQQVEAAIDNGVGVASVLNTGASEPAHEAGIEASEPEEVPLTAGVEAAVDVLPAPVEQKEIVEPVDPAAVQAATGDAPESASGTKPDTAQDGKAEAQPETEAASASDVKEEQTDREDGSREAESAAENEASSEADPSEAASEEDSSDKESASEKETEASEEESPSEEQKESAVEETSSESSAQESASESQTESSVQESSSESQTESSVQESASESQAESSVQEAPAQTESAAQTAAGTVTESTEAAPAESTAQETSAQAEEVQAASAAASHTPVSSEGGSVAEFALQFVGNPYEYGGTSLTNGADCSGFVMSVYENFGVSLPHSSSADRSVGTEVAGGLSNAQAGDIVCYSGHVGIYIGNGQIVHASTEETGIKVSEADYRTPITVRRIFN